jgi:hypothetical protein
LRAADPAAERELSADPVEQIDARGVNGGGAVHI